jgi:hypothetical protein
VIFKKKNAKDKANSANNLSQAGIVPVEMDLVERADVYWRSAHRWLPKVSLWIKACCVVCFLSAFACVLIVFMRPRPTLLVSFPDGTTLCAPSPLDTKTRRPVARASDEARLCKMLANRANRPEIEAVDRSNKKEQEAALGNADAAPSKSEEATPAPNPSATETPAAPSSSVSETEQGQQP